MLHTWQRMAHDGIYMPSRNPSFPFAEFAIGSTAAIGGAWLSNLLIATCAATTAVLAYILALKLEVARPALVTALFLASPVIMVQSATSIDYMIAFSCLLGGMVLILHGRVLPGVILLAVSVGTRMPMLFYAGFFLWLMARQRTVEGLRFVEAFAVLFFVSGLFYLPAWIHNSLGFGWITASWIEDQGMLAWLARLAVKPTRIFGLIPSIAAVGLLAVLWWRGRLALPWRSSFATRLSLVMCLITVAIYMRLPTDVAYMIFAIPFLGILLVECNAVPVLDLLVAGGLLTAVVEVEPLVILSKDGDECGWLVRSARISPHFVAGPVLAEIQGHDLGERCGRQWLLIDYEDANRPLP